MATLSALQTDLNHIQPDKNVSTLSGGHLPSSHSRRISTGKQVSKPQGGVFQSGPGKAPHNIMTNNFIGANPSLAAAQSPQFLHLDSGNDKFNFASQVEGRQATKSAATLSTDHLKSQNSN